MIKTIALITAMTLTTTLYPAAAAEFALERALAGRTIATGSFSAINGVKRKFVARCLGTLKGDVFTLREDFTFEDGETDRKTWRFTRKDEKTWVGTREDVIGTTTLRISGKRARFSYDVWLDGKNQKNRARFHDTLELLPDGSVKNVAWVTKFGLPVAHVKVDFTRD